MRVQKPLNKPLVRYFPFLYIRQVTEHVLPPRPSPKPLSLVPVSPLRMLISESLDILNLTHAQNIISQQVITLRGPNITAFQPLLNLTNNKDIGDDEMQCLKGQNKIRKRRTQHTSLTASVVNTSGCSSCTQTLSSILTFKPRKWAG